MGIEPKQADIWRKPDIFHRNLLLTKYIWGEMPAPASTTGTANIALFEQKKAINFYADRFCVYIISLTIVLSF